MTKTRLEAFSDGVIAILITIMVLELKVPHESSLAALKPLIPTLLSYIISFIIIGIYWGNHHHLLHTVKNVNSQIIWANLHLLFWISLIPFATAWMGENDFSSLTVAGYACIHTCCGFAYYILLLAIIKTVPKDSPLLIPLEKQQRKGLASFLIFLASIPIAFVNSILAACLFSLVALIWFIPDRNIEKIVKE